MAEYLDSRTERAIIKYTDKRAIPVHHFRKNELQRFCGAVPHQGVVAETGDYKYINKTRLFEKITNTDQALVLILDQIQDVHNVGAIVRTAEVAGITAVIVPEKGGVRINETVAKTSAGAIFHCDIHQTNNVQALLKELAARGLYIAAMVAHQEMTIYQADLKKPLAIVVGSEGKGVRKNLFPFCSYKLSIQQFGRLDSLNVSVATALVLFEARRQRLLNEL